MRAALILVVALPAGAHSGQPPRLNVGQEHPISDGGNNYTEVHLAIHPDDSRQMILAAMKETQPPAGSGANAGRHTTEILLSVDSGATWESIQPASELWQNVELASDPWLAFGKGHDLYYTILPHFVDRDGRSRRGIHIYRSADGGRSWHQGTSVPLGIGGSYDKTSVAVDSASEKFGGNVYVLASQTWSESNGDTHDGPVIARSNDGGRSFAVSLRFGVNNLRHFIGHPPVVLGDGALVVPIFEFGVTGTRSVLQHPRLRVLTSSDGGDTSSGPYLVSESVEAIPPFLASDHSSSNGDRLFIAWTGQKQDRNIYVSRSDDKGKTWLPPVRVNSTTDDHGRRYKPMLTVSGEGVVGAAWRDSRDDPGDRCTHVYFSASMDGGLSFLPDVRVSGDATCADSWWGDDGEYFGLDATDGEFRLVWSDNRSGSHELVMNSVTIGN